MDERLKANMRFLCDESRMLTGVTVAYGTPVHSEWTQYGRAQELTRTESGFLPAVRPLQPDTIYDLASLTKLFTAVVTLALVESGRLSLDELVGQIDPRFASLRHVTVGDVLGFRVSLQTPGRIDAAPSREAGLSRLFAMSVCSTPAIRVYSDMNAMAIKYIIEAKTGMSLFEAIRTWILSPAGMQETFAVVPEAWLDALRGLLQPRPQFLSGGANAAAAYMLRERAAALSEMINRAETMKYAVIIVSSVPMLVLYPFLQKFFVKGVMIGAVKG